MYSFAKVTKVIYDTRSFAKGPSTHGQTKRARCTAQQGRSLKPPSFLPNRHDLPSPPLSSAWVSRSFDQVTRSAAIDFDLSPRIGVIIDSFRLGAFLLHNFVLAQVVFAAFDV